eukprot:scaffold115899_cov33-Prasinocladus_malaysianus.AAC.1
MTCYVEAEKAAHELGVRYRGGFFETDQDFCDAIMDGAFNKAIQVCRHSGPHMLSCVWVYNTLHSHFDLDLLAFLTILRDNVGEQIADAIEEAVAPRMRLMQQTSVLEDFINYFRERGEAIDKGANVMLFFTQAILTILHVLPLTLLSIKSLVHKIEPFIS